MKNVLCIAVHPDDETLGCGGTLLKHAKAGDSINWLIITAMSEKTGFSKKQMNERDLQIKKVKNIYNFQKTMNLKFPPAGLDQISTGSLVQAISKAINKITPEVIYCPFRGDVHSDHRIVFNAVMSATKTFRAPFIKKIMMMETLSETDFALAAPDQFFIPNIFVDISETITQKIDIFKIYESEVAPHPFPRSIETIKSLATLRGAASNFNYAESFMLVKEVLNVP